MPIDAAVTPLTIMGRPVPSAMVGALNEAGDDPAAALERDGYLLLRGVHDAAEVMAARREVLARLAAVDEIAEPSEAAIATGRSRRAELNPDLGAFWRSVSEGPALRRVTRDRGVLLIADEVMSGFGRCGQWFAWQQHGPQHAPDLITCAKGLTGAAAPLGAVIVSAAVYARIERRMLPIGLTYCGHPLSCAAGLAAVRAYRDEGLIERSRQLGAWMFERLQRLQERHQAIGEVRGGDGLFAVVELVADRVTREPLAPWPQTPPALAALLRDALAQGLSLASRGNLIILAPPLVIAQDELADAIERLDALLAHHLSR